MLAGCCVRRSLEFCAAVIRLGTNPGVTNWPVMKFAASAPPMFSETYVGPVPAAGYAPQAAQHRQVALERVGAPFMQFKERPGRIVARYPWRIAAGSRRRVGAVGRRVDSRSALTARWRVAALCGFAAPTHSLT